MTATWAYALNSTYALIARLDDDDLSLPSLALASMFAAMAIEQGLDDDNGQGRVPSMALLSEFADRQDRYGALLVALGRRT